MKLILFGGVQGVGKTTLLSWLESKFAGQITLLNPGELFRRYCYDNKVKTTEEVEELILNKLEKMPNDSIAVVHWHYAVKRPSGYIPQINFPRLKRMAKSGNIEKIVLLVVEAPVALVGERRLRDRQTKKRDLCQPAISEEIAADEKFLVEHRLLFSQILGAHNVTIVRLTNTDLPAAKVLLGNFFKSLLR